MVDPAFNNREGGQGKELPQGPPIPIHPFLMADKGILEHISQSEVKFSNSI